MAGVKGHSGGRRPGAGKKPKTKADRELDGNAGHRPRSVAPLTSLAWRASAPPPAAPVVDEFDAPDDLTAEERSAWLELAPHAFKNRTLTRATALSFRILCRNVWLERVLSSKEPGSAAHRGMLQRVDAELLRFNLSPCGKPMVEEEQAKPANPLEKYLKHG